MLLQASSAAGGADVLVSDILPQLLPLFTCAAAQRKLYGCSEPAAPDARAGAATSLASGECAGQSMQQRMRQALNIASHSVPGVLPPLRLMEGPNSSDGLPSMALGSVFPLFGKAVGEPQSDKLWFEACCLMQSSYAGGHCRSLSIGDEAESGYWDVVYLLYPEMAEAAGLGVLHELVSSWPLIERSLAVRLHLSRSP